ncbi:ABC transporter [miscellaneous Crenarchaeota group-1 archaeon SG8-32-1]|uniref:ABC transporter n=1 Tax=miscellaneous Crenarchaeota group-1 archaeon SG8-32-1 TaxID=1685124 RepID=A0A0M0C2N5_9ARCH|nr:MAG: ABC transporter [miscellaneous Crenarchaeota group-1 archaeon SG8-32-1]
MPKINEFDAKREKTPVLEVSNLYVKRANSIVVEDANFTINKGDYVGIVGPNGGGKTTLLLAILNIIPRTRGSIRLFGQDIESFSSWDKVAYVSQGAVNFDSHFPLSVRELVGLGRVNRGNLGRNLKRIDWEIVDEVLDFMGISDIASRRIGQLSGGQKQRVFVAKALVRKPEIILLDEPIVGVDAKTQEKFYKKLSDLNIRKGITIMLVTHDLTAVFCRMSKVMCMNQWVNVAEIIEGVNPEELLRKAYGEHFHFVFHNHECERTFEDE